MQPVFVDGGATIFLTSARWHLSGVCFFRLFFIFVLLVPRRYNCTTCTLGMPMIHRRHQPLIWISLFYVHVNHQSWSEKRTQESVAGLRRWMCWSEMGKAACKWRKKWHREIHRETSKQIRYAGEKFKSWLKSNVADVFFFILVECRASLCNFTQITK